MHTFSLVNSLSVGMPALAMVHLRCAGELPTKARSLMAWKLTGTASHVQKTEGWVLRDKRCRGFWFAGICPSTSTYARVRTFAGKRKSDRCNRHQPLLSSRSLMLLLGGRVPQGLHPLPSAKAILPASRAID